MIEMGFVVALGLLITFAKLGWKARLWMLSHPIFMDVAIFIGLFLLHSGTYSGVMVATIGALTCSCVLWCGRWAFGYMTKVKGQRIHMPGHFNVKV